MNMKITYKYVDKWFTMVRLDEKSLRITKVKTGQTVESDRDPKYFLTAWFVSPDIRTKADVNYVAKKLEAEKTLSVLDSSKNVSKHTKVISEVNSMDDSEVRSKLKELNIFFNGNTWTSKLKKKLIEAMLK